MDCGMRQMSLYAAEAGTDFVDGPPPVASVPDVVDQIAMAVGAKKDE